MGLLRLPSAGCALRLTASDRDRDRDSSDRDRDRAPEPAVALERLVLFIGATVSRRRGPPQASAAHAAYVRDALALLAPHLRALRELRVDVPLGAGVFEAFAGALGPRLETLVVAETRALAGMGGAVARAMPRLRRIKVLEEWPRDADGVVRAFCAAWRRARGQKLEIDLLVSDEARDKLRAALGAGGPCTVFSLSDCIARHAHNRRETGR